jgi:hypothetical protein
MAKCDSCIVKVPLARDAVGRNPTDRGKKGTKRSLAVESHGLPIGIVVSGANRYDNKVLEETLRSIVTAHSEGAKVCLDAGYVGAQKIVEGMGYEAHTGPVEKKRGRRKRIPRSRRGGGWWKYAIRG